MAWGFVDVATKGGEIKPGEWRGHQVQYGAIQPIAKLKGRRKKSHAKKIREALKDYLNQENILPWQVAKVRTIGQAPDSDFESEIYNV